MAKEARHLMSITAELPVLNFIGCIELDFVLLHKGCWREARGHIGEEVRFTKTIP